MGDQEDEDADEGAADDDTEGDREQLPVGEDEPEDDDVPAASAVVPVFELHREDASRMADRRRIAPPTCVVAAPARLVPGRQPRQGRRTYPQNPPWQSP